MLTEIRCDSFSPQNRIIKFKNGLNVVLGSNHGSNAIGKSTLLWIIDYAFGGTAYSEIWKDIQEYIGTAPVFFTFCFENTQLYYYRTINEARQVCSCDKSGHLIKKMTLEEYRKVLYDNYQIGVTGIQFGEFTNRFFRIYGGDNIYEKTPYLTKPREQESKAVDFLVRLDGHSDLLVEIRKAEEQYGIRGYSFSSATTCDTDKIEQNNNAIASLQNRLHKLMTQADDTQMTFFGFDKASFEKMNQLKKELRNLVRKRNTLHSQLSSIMDVQPFTSVNMEEEFQELQSFFPQADMKPFSDIERFHKRLREILNEQISEEVQRLTSLIAACDSEIATIQKKLNDSGFAREMSERVISQCVSISRSIERYQDENEELLHQKELQEARLAAQTQMNALLAKQRQVITELTTSINNSMKHINDEVTEGQETAPRLDIDTEKAITFGTPGNTSEGTAFKSMILYDLALAELYPLPALIHDSNILKRIGDTHLQHILKRYVDLGKQVFIAFDKADSATQTAEKMLEDAAVIHLDDTHLLFGTAWSKNR